jgi:hypothetical protein
MKIVLPPSKFEHILRVVLISDSKSLLEKCTVVFKKEGLSIKDRSYNSVITIGAFNTSYFKEYEPPTVSETVVFTKSLLDKIKLFKNEEQITVHTTENKICMKSPKVSYEEELLESSDENDFGIIMEKTENGILPKKVKEEGYNVAFTLQAKHLQNIPDSETVTFRTSDANKESVECEIVDRGVTKISFPIEKFDVLGKFEGNFNGTVLSKIVSNLSGNVWVVMTDTGLVLNVVNPDYVLMYGQASQSQKRTVEVETQ